MASKKTANGEQESRRILGRIAQESDPGTVTARLANRARNHMAAADVDASDRIEQLGTRIGRAMALLITIAVLAWAVYFLIQGG